MRYNIPKKFTGEERYLFIFTKKALGYTAIGVVLSTPLIWLFSIMDMSVVGVVIAIVLCIPFYAAGMITYPANKVYNGGISLDRAFLRFAKRKVKGKCIYVSDERSQ